MSHYDALRPERIPYNDGQSVAIPGKVEVERYDYGYPGVTYHDTTEGIQVRGSTVLMMWILCLKRRHRVTNTKAGEWLEYSVDIKQTCLHISVIMRAPKRVPFNLNAQGKP